MLNFPIISFRLFSKQRRKVRIYIILEPHLRKKFMAPLPLLINPSFWDSKTQRVISSYKGSSEINRKLKILRDQFTKNHDFENIKSLSSFKKIVKNLCIKYVIKDDLTLLSAIERYIEFAPQIKNKKTGSIGLKEGTIVRYEFLKKIYLEYSSKRDKYILIDCFKISDIDEFTSYLLNEKKYGVGTTGKTISQIKTVYIKPSEMVIRSVMP